MSDFSTRLRIASLTDERVAPRDGPVPNLPLRKTRVKHWGCPSSPPKNRRAYFRNYMRRRRARDKAERPARQLAAAERLTEAWEKAAEKAKAPAPALLCVLCDRPQSE